MPETGTKIQAWNCVWISTGGRPGPASLGCSKAAEGVGSRQESRHCQVFFGAVHCTLSITLPVKPGGQLLWSGLWGQAQLQGRAVIMTHPLKSSNAARELASLSDSSQPFGHPSRNVAFIKYPHSETFESKNKGTSCLPDGRHFLRHNFT